MQDYLARARAALDAFDASAAALGAAAQACPPSPLRQTCIETVAALLDVTAALRRSLLLPQNTDVDISDLQFRLEDETRRLAHRLKTLGDAVDNPTGASKGQVEALRGCLLDLEERAQRVAAGIFPNVIQGVREINRALWEMRLIWQGYGEVFGRCVRGQAGSLTSRQLTGIDAAALEIKGRFDAVNDLLNQLLTSPLVGDGAGARAIIEQARVELKGALKRTRSKSADVYKPFHGFLDRAERLADRVSALFDAVRVPVFPTPERLDAFRAYIDAALYRDLAGVERFALMNIGARLQSIPLGRNSPETLASPRFGIQVFNVFADRVYFSASADFLTAVRALVADGVFVEAPAGLHEFRDGSYKQRQGRKGNLQVSYAKGSQTDPSDPSRVRVDADIDLYRGTVAHLFGEVLVNHLTGSKTDQFRVWDILAGNGVRALGGFEVISV